MVEGVRTNAGAFGYFLIKDTIAFLISFNFAFGYVKGDALGKFEYVL